MITHGVGMWVLINSSTNTWAGIFLGGRSDSAVDYYGIVTTTLDTELTQISLTSLDPSTMDGGEFNIMYF
jgi:hypothetical protein